MDLEVSNYGEQGFLGITTVDDKIYLFFTEAFHDGGLSHGNKIYEYTWDGEKISNPKLIKSNDTIIFAEGCLSIPNVHEDITRHKNITVEYQNRDGKRKKIFSRPNILSR